ncbi:MAG: ABC transporter permease [Anaerolineaceae bacterium]|nr:ABC transporter permease [Anaerolineaceae bacterium]
MKSLNLQRVFARNTYLISFILLVIVLGINYIVQNNVFELRVLNNNLRTLLPLILLAVGQSIVVIGGGLDLSVGTLVSMLSALLVTWVTPDSTPDQILLAVVLVCAAGMLAGLVNGLVVAYLRLQPMITTYATSFIFSGIALLLLPRPGGSIPRDLSTFYRSPLLDIPLAFYAIALLLLFWSVLRTTRYAQYLYATGSSGAAAYATGVPVRVVRVTTYVWSGLFAALASLTLMLSTGGASQANIGDDMTLDSIVAVVLGGTRLSGGQGGIAGAIIGVMILRVIRNVIFFAAVPTWSQTLVNALIIIAALAGPGLIRLIRRSIGR